MAGIWRFKDDNPYGVTIYDEKYKRKRLFEAVNRLGINPRRAHKKCLEEMRKNGELD